MHKWAIQIKECSTNKCHGEVIWGTRRCPPQREGWVSVVCCYSLFVVVPTTNLTLQTMSAELEAKTSGGEEAVAVRGVRVACAGGGAGCGLRMVVRRRSRAHVFRPCLCPHHITPRPAPGPAPPPPRRTAVCLCCWCSWWLLWWWCCGYGGGNRRRTGCVAVVVVAPTPTHRTVCPTISLCCWLSRVVWVVIGALATVWSRWWWWVVADLVWLRWW